MPVGVGAPYPVPVPDLHLRHDLDSASLDAIRHLLAETTRIEGHAPIGEPKMAHLAIGAKDWDGILVHEGDQLIGYAHLRWNTPGSDPRVAVEVVVHPDHRDKGVQAALLDATRTTVARSGGGRLFLWVHRVEDARDTLAHRMGFAIQRELAFMRRPAQPAPDVAPPPDGVTIRTYRGPEDAEAFPVLHALSPYHRALASPAAYPPTLVTTGDTDDRVVPAHSYKFAAALQAAQVGDAPVLLRVDHSAGHGAGKPVAKLLDERADVLAWHAAHLGLDVPDA